MSGQLSTSEGGQIMMVLHSACHACCSLAFLMYAALVTNSNSQNGRFPYTVQVLSICTIVGLLQYDSFPKPLRNIKHSSVTNIQTWVLLQLGLAKPSDHTVLLLPPIAVQVLAASLTQTCQHYVHAADVHALLQRLCSLALGLVHWPVLWTQPRRSPWAICCRYCKRLAPLA